MGEGKDAAAESRIEEQTVRSAQGFYSDSIEEAMSKLQHDRAELESLVEQLPESKEEARAQIQEMIDSFAAFEGSMEQAAQQTRSPFAQGATQQAVDIAGQAAQQAQDTAQGAAQQTQDAAGQAPQQAQEAAGQAAQQTDEGSADVQEPEATDAARQKAQELGVDLNQVTGSGAEERMAVKDAQPRDAAAEEAATAPSTHRLNVVFSESAYKAVQELARRNAKSVSELVRDAIALQKWFDDTRAEGWRILTEKRGRVREIVKIR